jgi:hypothetical protein
VQFFNAILYIAALAVDLLRGTSERREFVVLRWRSLCG